MESPNQSLRHVLVLNTGSTIGMQTSPDGYVCAPPGFLSSFCRNMPILHDSSSSLDTAWDILVTPVSEHGQRTAFKIVDYNPLLDSSNMTHLDWVRIAQDIVAAYDDWDAFMVLHGTDTMAYTCSALSFMLQNLNKTVIVTGSQIPLSRPRSDGVGNFLGALLLAGRFSIPEVCIYFADKLYRGNRCTKVDASGLNAFDSPNMAPLASMGISCSIRWDLVRPPSGGNIKLESGFCPDIVIIRIFPGPFNTLKQTLQPPLRGAVLQTFGAGNAPDKDPMLLEALREAYDNGVVVVNVTQCQSGVVEPHYATGQALAAVGVVAGRDMTPEAALVKLGWLLASGRDPEEIRRLMSIDMQGEITAARSMRFSLQDGKFLRSVFSAIQQNGNQTIRRGAKPAWEQAVGSNGLAALRTVLFPILLCAASAAGDIDAIQAMADEGANMDCANYDGRTPLHVAAAEGHVEVVKFLLHRIGRCDLAPLDRWENTPLLDACTHRRLEVVRVLVDAGRRLRVPDLRLGGILCSVVHTRDHDALACFAAALANLSAADYEGRTALHVAASEGNVDAASILLGGGAAVDIKDRWGRTPFDDAITPQNPKVHIDKKADFSAVVQMMRAVEGFAQPPNNKSARI